MNEARRLDPEFPTNASSLEAQLTICKCKVFFTQITRLDSVPCYEGARTYCVNLQDALNAHVVDSKVTTTIVNGVLCTTKLRVIT